MHERQLAPVHVPVLARECLELLRPALSGPNPVLVDATLGLGGHAAIFASAFERLRIIGIDRDPQAACLATEMLGERIEVAETTYDNIGEVLAERGITEVNGVLADLGLSSMQIDSIERGFSYSHDAPLDMRMSPASPQTAADLLASLSEDELARLLRSGADEPHARRIARAICTARQRTAITRTGQLSSIIHDAIGPSRRGHPAKRTFQALRIAVNNELQLLDRFLPAAIAALGVKGRIAIMSYHSLEDRRVKQTFAAGAQVTAPPDLPIVPLAQQPYLRLITRGAVQASSSERESNPRSASVRLRVAERIRDTRSEVR